MKINSLGQDLVPKPTGQGAQTGEEARRDAAQGETGRRTVSRIRPAAATATTAATPPPLWPAAAHATHVCPTSRPGQQSSNLLVYAAAHGRPDGHKTRLRAGLSHPTNIYHRRCNIVVMMPL